MRDAVLVDAKAMRLEVVVAIVDCDVICVLGVEDGRMEGKSDFEEECQTTCLQV